MSAHRLLRKVFVSALALYCIAFITSCNDAPNTVGTELIPGTDTIYAISSLQVPLLPSASTQSDREPLYNPDFMLYGKTVDSEGRLFVEFLQYPRLGSPDSFEIISSELMMYPQDYKYGDTSNLTLSVHSYELKQLWYPQATWDSIWAPDGSTSYYSTSDPQVCSFEKTLTAEDSVVYVPFDTQATKRWFVLGSDSTTRDQLFGLVLLPETAGSIRQFRNNNNGVQVMKLRVIYKHADSVDNDTTYLESAVADFVDTPPAAGDTDLVVQGARLHRTAFQVKIDSLPPYSIILGSSFQASVNDGASQNGTFGRDEVLTLTYLSPSGTQYAFSAYGDASGQYIFPNITTIAQLIRKYGGTGTLLLEPQGVNKYERMNRQKLFGMESDSLHRPRLNIVYTISTVFQ